MDLLRSLVPAPKDEDGLTSKVLSGGAWVGSLNVLSRLLETFKLIVLARLLSPSDFGLMGIALLALAALEQLSQLGVDQALIQEEKEDIDRYLSTAWCLKIVRAVLIISVLYVTSSAISDFLGEPQAGPILQVIGITYLLRAFMNPATIYFEKNLNFRKYFSLKFSSVFVDVIVAIAFGFVFQNVWALVAGILARHLTQLLVSYRIDPFRPSLELDTEKAKELMGFGKWIWASGITTFVSTQGDDGFVVWLLGADALGFYQMAFRLSNAPATEISKVISKVAFPTYSVLQNQKKRLRRAYLNTLEITFYLTVPMAVGILVVAPEFTVVVLGEEWVPIVPALQVMAIAGFVRGIAATGGAIFRGTGAPEWDFRMNLLRAITILLTIWPLTNYMGITGAAISITLGIGITIPVWLVVSRRIISARYSQYANRAVIPGISSGVMAIAVQAILSEDIVGLLAGILTGVLFYFLFSTLLYRYIRPHPVSVLKNFTGTSE
ncbi:lipopolysaccharide biosynthesis protein [Natrinema sp. CBA1119]|uniref:lipopolysaccharide biosynthesis protein n=1 Tax=Natrinema sp. CBA1119 TaxID=1608465 RepID=UPI000BF57A29|nr:lipopolysaccharide biosynthesis protein [Natrinema sp. CBA1119]PGF17151.1 lipopolysaccharide biosynthesis protein [Natrinema sp. CBA1119]